MQSMFNDLQFFMVIRSSCRSVLLSGGERGTSPGLDLLFLAAPYDHSHHPLLLSPREFNPNVESESYEEEESKRQTVDKQ